MELSNYLYEWLPYVAALLFCLLGFTYFYLYNKLKYWEKKGVTSAENLSLIFGNVKDMVFQRVGFGEQFRKIYETSHGLKYVGMYFFQRPMLLIRDPELIKTIMVKDFSHFTDHNPFASEEGDPLQGRSLLNLQGQRWRQMRIKLTPTFTSGKMKKMFQFVCDCGEELKKYLKDIAESEKPIEMRDMMARFTTDVIATCAFGIEVNSVKHPDSEFRKMGFELTKPINFFDSLKLAVILSFPKLAKILRLGFTKQEITNFFRNVLKDTMAYRENNNITRNDFLDLLVKIKKLGKVDDDDEEEEDETEGARQLSNVDEKIDFSDDDLAAQVFFFFVGGFETSSTLLSFALYELALNPEVQRRLREDIDRVLETTSGKLTYQGVVNEMQYLDKVVSETLRKYPPITVTDRVCTKPYTIPGTDLNLDVGSVLEIPIFGLHHDPKYFPNPEEFDPERFSEENRKKRPLCSYLSFGEGPRMCIGNRFGLMQAKVCLAALLSAYEVCPCEKTQIPFQFDPKNFFLSGKDGTWLKIVQRTDK